MEGQLPGVLADPTCLHEPIDLQGSGPDALIPLMRGMVTIRVAERILAKAREEGLIGGPVHLGVGQEGVAVGVSALLRKTDRVFGAHRSHSHVLALGSSPRKLFAEILGKETGLSKGMGGSMHLWDEPNGFMGSVPIVAGTVPLAVGAAHAERMKGTDNVGVSYLGDGACEEGAVHESLNLARMLNAPVIFVVENNLFSSHMFIDLRQPSNMTARFAQAHRIPFEVVDGNDVVAVREATQKLVEAARRGEGPGFLEAVTYRWYGHVDFREDIDVGLARSETDVANWRARDPVGRLARAMVDAGIWSEEQQAGLEAEVRTALEAEWEKAVGDPYPVETALMDRVYAKRGRD